jgi:predicted alpha-1,2-mannosidase
MAQSLVADAEQGGGLPIWPVANDESSVMVGDPSDPILASMYAFGARDFDARAALAAMLKGADDQKAHVRLYAERPGLEDYLKKGYVAQRPEAAWSTGAASVTLEDTSADFAISQLAKALGDTTTARRFLLRSAYWRNLFDPETKYIRARDGEGKFLPDFSPAKTDGFVEGNAAQYTWMVPYDLPGVIQSLGGPEAARARLDEYFSEYGKWTGSGYTAHFFISNEPSFGNPWIYNWTGHPWRTQEVVSKTLHDLFTDSAGGLPGNDDLGATSSWAVFAYLGLYPEIPGVGGLTLNTPTFPNVTLKLGGHELRIRAQGAPEKSYIQSVALDGKPLRSYWLDWEQVKSASVLEFTLSGEPSKEVGGPLPSFSPAAR